jgi:hypothetical protein
MAAKKGARKSVKRSAKRKASKKKPHSWGVVDRDAVLGPYARNA